jgi:hypothetical protein
MMRWWWFGVAVEKPEILRELEQMKADGIGGAELAFVYPQVVNNPARGLVNEPFVGAAMLDNVRYAQAEARKLGLRLDVTLGSGWPYGGPATTLDQAAGRLRIVQVPVPAGATTLPPIALEEGDTLLSIALVQPRASDPNPSVPAQWDSQSAQTLPANLATAFPASPTPRIGLVFLAGHTRQVVKRAASGAEGWVLDPFSRGAVATHLRTIGEPLVQAFGATSPYAVFSDSLEAYGADWTPRLPQEFLARRGYDLLPHLPELAAGDTPQALKVRHDWGKTLTELVDENYLTQINRWAIAHRTRFRSQTYGEPAVSFSSQRLAALPEGEGPHWREFSTLRWASSANHVFGNTITSAETFTWLHSPAFRATPLDMKAEADLHFLMGVNQIIGHGWPYSPPQVGEPGWSLYAAAVFNDHNPWHPVMPAISLYLQRISYLLRQGQPANQVAVLLPTDDAWAGFSPGNVSVTGAMEKLIPPSLIDAILSAGYNYDFTDADAIGLAGLHHSILVLPPTDRIPLATLRKIDQFVAAGGKAIAIGRAPSLDPQGEPVPEIAALSRRLFNTAQSTLLPGDSPSSIANALHQAAQPDFQLSQDQSAIGFLRRKLPRADIYFVANTANHPVHARAAFATAFNSGQRWDTGSGMTLPGAAHLSPRDVPIDLAPYESAVFVFSQGSSPSPAPPLTETLIADLSTHWSVAFPAAGTSRQEESLQDWTADPATRFYSGEAVYTKDFSLDRLPAGTIEFGIDGGEPVPIPATLPAYGMRAWFDPPIREAANVFLNGQAAGSLWRPPYRLEVTKLLHAGVNRVEIRVFNTAINAWAALPPHDYTLLNATYGQRFEMQDLDQVHPVPSGLLGQVRLFARQPQ